MATKSQRQRDRAVLAEMDQRKRDTEAVRVGVQSWFFACRDMLKKIADSASAMSKEVDRKPDGLLAAVVDGRELDAFLGDVLRAHDALQELTVTGTAHLLPPGEWIFGSRDAA